MGKRDVYKPAQRLVLTVLSMFTSICSANSVIIDGLSPYLVPDHYQKIEEVDNFSDHPVFVIGNLSVGDSTNANLGTSAATYSLGGFPVAVDDALRAKESDLTRAFLAGQLNLTSSGWAAGGSLSKTRSSQTSDFESGALYLSKTDSLGQVKTRSLAGVYRSSTAASVDTRAKGLGSSFEASLIPGLDSFGSVFATWFDGDLAAFKGGLSLDLNLVLKHSSNPKIQPYIGYVAQNYRSDSKHDEFSAKGFVVGVLGQLKSIQVLGYRERKRLNYSSAVPLIGGEQDRTRDRIGLRLSNPTRIGVLSVEYLDDQFSSDFQLSPADRRQVRFGIIIPFTS